MAQPAHDGSLAVSVGLMSQGLVAPTCSHRGAALVARHRTAHAPRTHVEAVEG